MRTINILLPPPLLRTTTTLDSPEHSHAQSLHIILPSAKSRPSPDRNRIPQSHLTHSSSIQCRPSTSLGSLNLLSFDGSCRDVVLIVPGNIVLLCISYRRRVGLQFVHCGQEVWMVWVEPLAFRCILFFSPCFAIWHNLCIEPGIGTRVSTAVSSTSSPALVMRRKGKDNLSTRMDGSMREWFFLRSLLTVSHLYINTPEYSSRKKANIPFHSTAAPSSATPYHSPIQSPSTYPSSPQ